MLSLRPELWCVSFRKHKALQVRQMDRLGPRLPHPSLRFNVGRDESRPDRFPVPSVTFHSPDGLRARLTS